MITLAKKRIRNQSEVLSNANLQLFNDLVESLERNRTNASNGVKILSFVNQIMPIEISNCWDILGDITLQVPARSARKVLRKFREAGVEFGSAGYELAYEKGPRACDMVWVKRIASAVSEGSEAPKFVADRLSVRWLAKYKGGGKCQIVESKYTNRTIVCSGKDE